MNFAWSQIETTVASKLAPFKKYKWRIVAVTVFLVIFSPVAVVTYLSSREQYLYVDNSLYGLTGPWHMNYPPVEVVLESIDFVEGTAHLRADLRMNKSQPLLLLAPLWTEHRDPVPVEVLFGRFAIHDEFPSVLPISLAYEAIYGTPLHGDWSGGRPSDFSESAPTTEADVSIDGDSWWYPFDEYVIAAQVDCVVVATPDREKYFNIPSDEYSLASKLPNFIVRNATAKDVEYWFKHHEPPIKDKDLKKIITKYYRTDFWRDGSIRLVLTRPLFPRFFAVFFGIIALIWIGVVTKVSDPKQLSLNVFGYFLALWAIRSALAAGALTGPLFMDYATLGLYALLIAVVVARVIWIRKT